MLLWLLWLWLLWLWLLWLWLLWLWLLWLWLLPERLLLIGLLLLHCIQLWLLKVRLLSVLRPLLKRELAMWSWDRCEGLASRRFQEGISWARRRRHGLVVGLCGKRAILLRYLRHGRRRERLLEWVCLGV